MTVGVAVFLAILGAGVLALIIAGRVNPFTAILCVVLGILAGDAGLGGHLDDWCNAIWSVVNGGSWPGRS